jgi:ligand-binding sensor domain-containing protein
MSFARSLRRKALPSLAALSCFAALLCPPPLRAQEYRFEYLGANQGLTNLVVRNLYQDSKGYLWISTENGVFRYDGEHFLNFEKNEGLPTSSGVAFGETPDGSVLVGGNIGLFRLAGNRFEPIPLPNAKSVIWTGGIHSDSAGHTFIATNNGLMILTSIAGKYSIAPVPIPDGVSDHSTRGLWVEGQTAWYGCGTQLCRFKSGRVTVFGVQSGLGPVNWTVIGRDKSGALWVRGRTLGIAVLLPGAARFKLVKDSPLPQAGLTGIAAIDSDGDLIFPASNGLIIHNQSGWHSVGIAQGLHGTVYSVLQDREGTVWVGLAGRGLVRWAGYKHFEAFTSQSGLPSDLVYQVLPDKDGSVWAGTESGLSHGVPHNAAYTWTQIPAFAKVPVHAVQRDPSGALWIGTETLGLARLDPITHHVTWFSADRGLPNVDVSSVVVDRAARVWIATEAGLFVLAPPYYRAAPVSDLPHTQFFAIAESTSGEIWAGGIDGLYRLSQNSWRQFSTKDGLTHDGVLALAASANGDLWVGYRFGGEIDRIASSPAGIHVIPALTEHDSGSRLTYSLGFDRRGRLWAGTEHGLDVLSEKSWTHIDSNDGLIWGRLRPQRLRRKPRWDRLDRHQWRARSIPSP